MTSMFRQSTNRLTVWLFALCLLFPFSKLSSAWRNTATQDKAFSISAVSKASSDSIMPERLTFPDSVALAAPEAAGRSVSSLVAYLKQHLSTDDQLARAIYTWVSRNIKYNVYITYTSRNEEADETKEIQKILSERKGICQDYALLFKALVKEAGMDAYVIDGYNRRDGALLPDPHEWCAAKVSGKWYMFDPTWGAGFVENYQFIPSPNHRFCKLLPDTLLKTHMPFDPMFQFRERPLSYEEFDTGVVDEQRSVPVFYWADTLALYARQDTLERLVSVRQRMLSNGRSNDLVYNMAMDLQGKATDAINEFVRYRNKAFEPLKPDAEIQAMVDVPEELINRADSAINSIRTAPERYREPILKLRDQIMEVATTVYKHKLLLRQYFKLPAKQRKGMFKQTK